MFNYQKRWGESVINAFRGTKLCDQLMHFNQKKVKEYPDV